MRREDEMNFDDGAGGELSPAERELEAAMGALNLAAPRHLNRDRILFEAGAASARRSLNAWRAAAAILVAGLGVSFFVRQPGEARVVREIVYVTTPTAPAIPASTRQSSAQPIELAAVASGDPARSNDLLLSSSNDLNYLSLRERALRWGVSAALPETSAPRGGRRAPAARRDRIDVTFPGDKL